MQKLSPTQHKIIRLKLTKTPRPRIAEQVNLSLDGVKWHLKKIYRILDVSNSTQLALAYGEYRTRKHMSELKWVWENGKLHLVEILPKAKGAA